MVPTLSITFMAISGLASVVLPAGLFFAWRRKYELKVIPLFFGMAGFMLFALVLEQILHSVVLRPDRWVLQQKDFGNPVPFVLYAIFAAGVFEETARFLSFKLLGRRHKSFGTSLSYGIGHGGMEAAILLGLASMSNIAVMLMINSGETAALESTGISAETIVLFTDASPFTFLVGALERVFAVTIHISLSVIVWFSVMRNGKVWLYPAAIALHAAANIPAALMQAGVTGSIFMAELFTGLAAAAVALSAVYACRTFGIDDEQTGEIKS